MAARIATHQAHRPEAWITEEIPRDLDTRLPILIQKPGSVLIDCVTLWVTNLILGLGGGPALEDDAVVAVVDRAASAAPGPAQVVWVSNEVGSGGIGEHALTRRFADLQGRVNQRLAAACDTVYLCVAGLSLKLK
jgi:adenosylcobinamide kinase/adenosylcobinamide-phosphate guanylyltransferase